MFPLRVQSINQGFSFGSHINTMLRNYYKGWMAICRQLFGISKKKNALIFYEKMWVHVPFAQTTHSIVFIKNPFFIRHIMYRGKDKIFYLSRDKLMAIMYLSKENLLVR